MSELPTIDPLKVAKREADKLRVLLADATYRETQLEVLAEALRDERDEARKALEEAQNPVQDITSLPEAV
jgi:predicted metal-binding transcription factor (methanogenesis marker protein 9)